jgi:peptide/nickel transport system substrate-binding protein
MMGRRHLLQLLAAGTASVAPLASVGRATAKARIPYGGVLRLHLPLALSGVDPHDLFSLDAAVLSSALFDSLYALDDSGRPYPTLARALPEAVSGGLRIELRPGLTTATGRPLAVQDVEFSLRRAAASGARLLLEPFGAPHARRGAELLFPRGDAANLAQTLASPLTAIVPRGFQPARPDGTGPFLQAAGRATWTLRRNPHAARGGAFLEGIDVHRSPDLSSALRAFEANEVDVGWLASGLHRARREARPLEGGLLGWVVLATGRSLGPWSAPGVAQTVIEAADLRPLTALGLSSPAPASAQPAAWRGPATELLVDGDSPQLVAIARALAEVLGGDASRLTVTPLPAPTFAARRASGDFGLLVDFVRTLARPSEDAALSLLTAAQLGLGGGSEPRAPGAVTEGWPSLTRRLRLGVLGELRLRGAHLGTFARLARWQLGDVHRLPALE